MVQAYLATRTGLKWNPIQTLDLPNKILPTKTSAGIETYFGIGRYYPNFLADDLGFVRMEAPQHPRLVGLYLDRKKLKLEWQLWPTRLTGIFDFLRKSEAKKSIRSEDMMTLRSEDFPIGGKIREAEGRIADSAAWYKDQLYCVSNGVNKFSKAGDEITSISRIAKDGSVQEHLLYQDHMSNRSVRPDRNEFYKQGASCKFVDRNSKVAMKWLDPETDTWTGPLEIFDLESRKIERLELKGAQGFPSLIDCRNGRYWFQTGDYIAVASASDGAPP